MYSNELQSMKIEKTKNGKSIEGNNIGEKKICDMLDIFCKRDDLINVPQDKVFELFDKFCDENNFPYINHFTLGKIIKSHFKVKRHRIRKGKELFWVYVNSDV